MAEYITVRQAAAQMGLSKQRIVQFIAAKMLPAVRLGNAWLILPKDLVPLRKRKTRPGRAKAI